MDITIFEVLGVIVAIVILVKGFGLALEEMTRVSFLSVGLCGKCGVALRYTSDHAFSRVVGGMHFYCPACYKRLEQSDFGYNDEGVRVRYVGPGSWGKYQWSNQPVFSDLHGSHFSVKCFLPIRSMSSDKKVLKKAIVQKQKIYLVYEGVRRSPLPASSPAVARFF